MEGQMTILVTGATGFIGKHIVHRLQQEGHHVLGAVRHPKANQEDAVQMDFAHMDEESVLVEKLRGVDILINAVGIIAPTPTQSFEMLHAEAPIRLFAAAKAAGVKRIIQVSALGSQEGTTPYHTSKNRADIYLRALGLPYAILHPSIVYGEDGKSTALFAGLASLPVTPLVGEGEQILQPIHIDDLVQTVLIALAHPETQIELNLVGEHPITYKGLLAGFRRWLGYAPCRSIALPTFGTDIIGKILNEPTVNSDNIRMLNQGNSAEVAPLQQFLGYTPKSIDQKRFSQQANHAQKLHASLYLIRPLLRWIIGLVWIWSGLVSAWLYPQTLALELLHEVGIAAPWDLPLLYLASTLDIVLGVLIIIGFRLRLLLYFSIVVIVVYTLLLSFLAPHHWLHPFGPVLKNIPLIITIFILSKLEEYR
jgi:nucleoside-diphosphate-sugar epimerase